MCETLEEWLNMHPATPRRSAGDKTRITISVSNQEMQNLSRVVNDTRLYSIHRHETSELIRHALHHYLPQLMELMDAGYKPMAELMRADLEKAGIGQTIDQIKDYLSTRGRELVMLISIGEVDRAFDHYEHTLGFVHQREGVWGKLLMKMLYEQQDMIAAREAMRRLGAVEENRLRGMEEQYERM